MSGVSNLKSACSLNKIYAFTLNTSGNGFSFPGWANRLNEISIVLGISDISTISAESFAQHVADWQSANGIIPADGVLGQRTWSAISQQAKGLPQGGYSNMPQWLRTPDASPQVTKSRTVIPGRAWLFAVFHELPEVGQRNVIRKLAVIPDDLILKPRNPNGTLLPAEHAGSINPNKSQFLSTSNRSHASVTGGRGHDAVLIDTYKVRRAGGRIVTEAELIADLKSLAAKQPSNKDGIESLITLIKELEGETLVEGTPPRDAVRRLSPQHMHYLRHGETLSTSDNAVRDLAKLDQSYKNARMVGRVGRVVTVVGVVVTAYDIGNAANLSLKQDSIRPIAAESIRQVGGWASGVAGAKLGFAAGAAVGIETGPGAIITGGIGALVCGALGYFGSDLIADYIYEN